MRAARAVGALLALGALLVGVPLLLVAIGSPTALLEVDLASMATRPVSGKVVLALLSVVGWAAWIAVVITTVSEFAAVLSRGRVRLKVPGTGWLRPLVGGLVIAAVAAPGIAHAEPSPPRDDPVAAAPVTTPSSPTVAAPAADTTSYQVAAGDELWDIAERELGSGERWREIVALNDDVDDSLRLTPGQLLRLPHTVVEASRAEGASVVVARGDSLWAIAERVLGDGERWPEIHRLNRDQVADPDEIDIGWVLQLPTAPEADVTVEPVPAAEPPPPPARDIEAVATDAPPVARSAVTAPSTSDESSIPVPTAPLPAERPGDTSEAVRLDLSPVTLVAGLGGITAVGLLAVFVARRRRQLLDRRVGRRVPPVPDSSAGLIGALSLRAAEAQEVDGSRSPTSALIGWGPGDEPLWLDLERERAAVLTGPEAAAGLAGILTSLSSAPWSAGVAVVHVGSSDWAAALDDPRITSISCIDEALASLSRRCAGRRLELRGSDLAQRRADPDRAPEWCSTVFVFDAPLSDAQFDVVGEALSFGDVGVSVVATSESPPPIAHTPIEFGNGWGSYRGLAMTPQLVSDPARRALIDLLAVSGSGETQPAPWWRDPAVLPPNVLPLPRADAGEEQAMTDPPDAYPEHPTLLLLGDVELSAPAGEQPSRAPMQCMEYCAWLLQHPGATATAMVHSLLVAETTRRSNMSRLRTWLGTSPDGEPYLPDAYSGRIRLDARVTSDWERFVAMLAGGVNTASDGSLRQALRLVRGEPLGSLAFQWHWAQTLRTDMVSMIVDAACVLADRAIDHGDQVTALWAVGRGRLAAPDDESLGAREIHALALAGRRPELERAVVVLTRSARAEGRDLDPEVARRIQHAIRLAGQPSTGAAP